MVGGAGGGIGGTLASYTTKGTIQITPNNALNITGGNLSLGINPSTFSINGNNELQVNTSSILNSLSYASYTDYGKIKINSTTALNIANGVLSLKFDPTKLSINASNELTVIAGTGGGTSIDIVPIGTVSWFAASAAPIGYLECNGAIISQVIHPELYAVIGTKFNKGGEGVGNFRLPDLRGEFIRGWDNGRIINPGRVFGSNESEELKSHCHTIRSDNNNDNGITGVLGGNGTNPAGFFAGRIGETGGIETRPRNVALLPCIKAFGTATGNTSILNFIEKPSTPSNGQTIIYNGSTSTWIASSVRQSVDVATSIAAGIVRPTNGLNIASGELSVKVDNSTIKISPTSGLYVAAGAGTTNVFDSTPVGTINWFAASAAPTGYLECDGAVFQQSLYPDLYSVIGKKYNIGGEATTNFRLPDLRGEFIRGWSHGKTGVDTGRVFGSNQVAYAGSNTFSIIKDDGDAQGGGFKSIYSFSVNSTVLGDTGGGDLGPKTIDTTAGDTCPRNVALLPCIKAVKTVTGTPTLLNFIEKPSPATAGQLLTYNGSTNTWVASAAPPTGTSIGVGQTWQNVTGARTAGVTYTNTTGRTITVIVGGSVGVNATWTFTVDGIQFTYAVTGGSFGSGSSHTCPIPPNSTYSASGFAQWLELR